MGRKRIQVGWLYDRPGYIGGAEMTQAEFKAAAPNNVVIIDCAPGHVFRDLDVYFVGNHWHYSEADLENLTGKVVRYYNDTRRLRVEPDVAIFCSPIQQERMGWVKAPEQHCIPPAVNYSAFKQNREERRQAKRTGTCSIAQWRNPGKGAQYIEEWARENGPLNAYGPGPFAPRGLNVSYQGELDQGAMPSVLQAHERFVFLPFELDPFCRTVAEAFYAGCEITTNKLVGATHYLENDPEALETAAEDFWQCVLA
jgi:hypothetical protein